MTILVTGGAGFIGSRIVRKLVERGHRVVSFGPTPIRGPLLQHANDIIPFRGDVARLEDVLKAVKQNRVRHIVHMAGFLLRRTDSEPYRAFLANGVGFNNVLEVARWTGVQRVIYASSISYYGPQEFHGSRVITEDTPPNPPGLYGALKLANEMSARRYREAYGLESCGIRITSAFGHGKSVLSTTGWVRAVMSLPAVGQPVHVPVAPDSRFPFIYVDDVAEMFILATFARKVSPIYLCGGYGVSAGAMVDSMKKYLPEAQVTFGDNASHLVYLTDHQLAQKELGFEMPSLEQRILDHINEARSEIGLLAISH